MAATIGDPYLLSSYSLPSKSKKGKEKVVVDDRPFVFASLSVAEKRRDGQVTIAAQGDGIHILDLSDLHPVSSHILGPSTSFASPAVTLASSENGRSLRRTYVAVRSAPDIASHEEEKIVWSWKEDAAEEIGSSSERLSYVLPHTISDIMACEGPEPRLLFLSKTGQVTQTDLDCIVLNTWAPPTDIVKVVNVFAFSRQSCSFVQGNRLSLNGTVLLLLLSNGTGLQLFTLAFGNDNDMVVLEPENVSNDNIEVAGISCTASGFLSVIRSNGLWNTYRIDVTNDQTKLILVSSPLSLRNLRFIAEKQGKSATHIRQVSLLGLKSSYVLLAGVTKGDKAEIALLLWDIQYGVLLHSHMLSIPSTLDSDSLSFTVDLVQCTTSQALLVLSPVASKKNSTQLRTTVLIVPFSVPDVSRLANVLGKAKAAASWLADDHSIGVASASVSAQDGLAKSQNDILQKVQDAIEEEKSEEAERLFFDWVKANTENKEKVKKEKKKKKADAGTVESGDESASEADVRMKEGDATAINKEKTSERRSILNHSFVSRLLELVMHPESPSVPYSPKIFRFLLQRNLVSNNMVSGGVLPILLQRNDWDSIRECFHKMIDLPESDVFQALLAVVKHHQRRSGDPNAMAVDGRNSAQVSTLQTFLATIVDYPASPVAWRNAIRQHFSDVEDLMSVLAIMDDWVAAWVEKDTDLELGEVKLNEQGIPIPVPKVRKTVRLRGTTMPLMENILLLLQAILDCSFLALLQHPPSHTILYRLSENLTPQISFNSGLQPLIGPLAPFAKAQAKAIANSKGGRKKEEVDWRKRRKAIQEQNAINLGPYQVEEIIF